MNAHYPCPCCGHAVATVLHSVVAAPVHSVSLLRSEAQARAVGTRPIQLALCRACNFIFNARFDATPQDYSRDYVSTQAHSPTFDRFHHQLALDLLERHRLHGRHVVEIGCGQGEFLRLLYRLGNCRGTGFDPAYVGPEYPQPGLRIVKDYYGEAYAHLAADAFVCKMTLEHIAKPAEFMATVRRAVGDRSRLVFFQVPDVTRILEEGAFWDIYYEHCSYFSDISLRLLFQRAGFEVLGTSLAYDGQYLMIEAHPADHPTSVTADIGNLAAKAGEFAAQLPDLLTRWRVDLSRRHAAGEVTVLWGGGSKAVAFLTTLGVGREVAGAVDINPDKHGTFLPGTGHRVLSPEDLGRLRPHRIIVMNPIYLEEVRSYLHRLGLDVELIPVTWQPPHQALRAVGA